jgi:hypothetical protein
MFTQFTPNLFFFFLVVVVVLGIEPKASVLLAKQVLC